MNSLSLSDKRISGAPYSNTSFLKIAFATVVASLSGMAFAMGHPGSPLVIFLSDVWLGCQLVHQANWVSCNACSLVAGLPHLFEQGKSLSSEVCLL